MLFLAGKRLLFLLPVFICASSVIAEIKFSVKYEDALTHEEKTHDFYQPMLQTSNHELVATDLNMHNMIVVLKMAQAMKTAMTSYRYGQIPRPPSAFKKLIKAKNILEKEVKENEFLSKKFAENEDLSILFLANKLAEAMKKNGSFIEKFNENMCNFAHQFSDLITKGLIPRSPSLSIGAFLKYYNSPCDVPTRKEGEVKLLSGIALHRNAMKAYVQIKPYWLTSKAQEKPRPRNISIAIDISDFRMSSTTGDVRMKWARDAALSILKILKNGDSLSIFTSGTDAQPIQPTIVITDETRKAIEEKIAQISATQGVANLLEVLQQSYSSVAAKKLQLEDSMSYQHRVILISDAQANQGEINSKNLQTLITEHALKNIGLVAIEIGSFGRDRDLDEALVKTIGNAKGGSYNFVSTEKDIQYVVEKIPQLLTPIAYNFKADISGIPKDWELYRVYGSSISENERPSTELMEIATIDLSNNGAPIILEYNIKNGNGFANVGGQHPRIVKNHQDVVFSMGLDSFTSEGTIKDITEGYIVVNVTRYRHDKANFECILNYDKDYLTIQSLRLRKLSQPCSATKTGKNACPTKEHGASYYFKCLTCSISETQAICPHCVAACHQGHELIMQAKYCGEYYCDCSYDVLENQKNHPFFKKKCLAKDKIDVIRFADHKYLGFAFKNELNGYDILIKENAVQQNKALIKFSQRLLKEGQKQSRLPKDILKEVGDYYKYFSIDENGNFSEIKSSGYKEEQFSNFIEDK